MKPKDGGMIWFICASYKFVWPRGIMAHLRFLVRLPLATVGYLKLRAEG